MSPQVPSFRSSAQVPSFQRSQQRSIYIQSFCSQELAHSFPRWRRIKLPVFNLLRTLSHRMEGVPLTISLLPYLIARFCSSTKSMESYHFAAQQAKSHRMITFCKIPRAGS
jgi:hypothetical protein